MHWRPVQQPSACSGADTVTATAGGTYVGGADTFSTGAEPLLQLFTVAKADTLVLSQTGGNGHTDAGLKNVAGSFSALKLPMLTSFLVWKHKMAWTELPPKQTSMPQLSLPASIW